LVATVGIVEKRKSKGSRLGRLRRVDVEEETLNAMMVGGVDE